MTHCVRYSWRSSHRARAYWGPYAISKAALEALARTYVAETVSTPVQVNLFNPRATRTRMRATAMPGEDPAGLKTPEPAAERIVGTPASSTIMARARRGSGPRPTTGSGTAHSPCEIARRLRPTYSGDAEREVAMARAARAQLFV
jgi:NAD(P)-dependent dehydrogenase (short-subunit alcohol dehydrogenase family)